MIWILILLMNKDKVIIIGAGGHAKVILSTLLACKMPIFGFVDDNPSLQGKTILSHMVLGNLTILNTLPEQAAICAFGDNKLRQATANAYNLNWVTLIHPSAYVHESVILGHGTVVFANATVQPDVLLGEHVIINTAASIDHDCRLDHFTHIAPGSHLGGGVHVGQGTLIGIGTNIKPYTTIGEWSILGAGSVVVKDIQSFVVAKGIPAKAYSNR